MKKTEIMNKLTRSFHKTSFQLKKHSPEILIVVGVVGTVASAVMACKATTKLSEILDESKETLDMIHDGMETGQIRGHEYPEELGKKDVALTYVQTGVKIVKLYGPSVALGALSLTCIISSNNILRKRNVALAAAYATVDKGFKEYRGRVIERFGKELDRELKYNIKAREIEETVIDEDGKEKKVKKTISVADPNLNSDYARFFDDGCTGWDKDSEYNLMFLKSQQAHANDILRTRGHLFLNEVYDMLGIPRSKAGNIVGWVYDEKNPNGDNFVDFGIYDLYDEKKRDFVNGYERSILLDFNVDGDIWSLMQ
jgi:hypothetical protein